MFALSDRSELRREVRHEDDGGSGFATERRSRGGRSCHRLARSDPRRRGTLLRMKKRTKNGHFGQSTDRSAVGESASCGKTEVAVV